MRQEALNSAPLPGNISSTRANTGRESMIGKPSKAIALNDERAAARAWSDSTATVTEAAVRAVKDRRFRSM
ncbi:hypothetical protein M2227_007579 [Bradyrhizobium elkanii]|nr:hypothetical protein [Bradyrhizobium elkanii]